jgi:hypothetical protein
MARLCNYLFPLLSLSLYTTTTQENFNFWSLNNAATEEGFDTRRKDFIRLAYGGFEPHM